MIDCIAGYHLNPWTCGIAKFNAILAKHLDVPVVGIRAVELGNYRAAAAVAQDVGVQRPTMRDDWTCGRSRTRPVRAVPPRVRRHGDRAAAGGRGRHGLLRQPRAVP